ncbi:MAG: hypothetical protein HQM15_10675, partial [Deltaproteobacteria bacterium]|nr:hypothetical protein [Deltaproteobacteria bacterium]
MTLRLQPIPPSGPRGPVNPAPVPNNEHPMTPPTAPTPSPAPTGSVPVANNGQAAGQVQQAGASLQALIAAAPDARPNHAALQSAIEARQHYQETLQQLRQAVSSGNVVEARRLVTELRQKEQELRAHFNGDLSSQIASLNLLLQGNQALMDAQRRFPAVAAPENSCPMDAPVNTGTRAQLEAQKTEIEAAREEIRVRLRGRIHAAVDGGQVRASTIQDVQQLGELGQGNTHYDQALSDLELQNQVYQAADGRSFPRNQRLSAYASLLTHISHLQHLPQSQFGAALRTRATTLQESVQGQVRGEFNSLNVPHVDAAERDASLDLLLHRISSPNFHGDINESLQVDKVTQFIANRHAALAAFEQAQQIPADTAHHAERVSALRNCISSLAACSDEASSTQAFLALENCYGANGSEFSAEHLRTLMGVRNDLRQAILSGGGVETLSGRVGVRAEHQARVLAGAQSERAIQEDSRWVNRLIEAEGHLSFAQKVALGIASGPIGGLGIYVSERLNERGGIGRSIHFEAEQARIHQQQAHLAPPRNAAEEAERLMAVQAYYQALEVPVTFEREELRQAYEATHPGRLASLHNTNERLYVLAAQLRHEAAQHPEHSAERLQALALLVSIDNHLQQTPYRGGDSRYPNATFMQVKLSQAEDQARSDHSIQHGNNRQQGETYENQTSVDAQAQAVAHARENLLNAFSADLTQLHEELVAAQGSDRASAHETQQAFGEYLTTVSVHAGLNSAVLQAQTAVAHAQNDGDRTSANETLIRAQGNVYIPADQLRPLQELQPLQGLMDASLQSSVERVIAQQAPRNQAELRGLSGRVLEDLQHGFQVAIQNQDTAWISAHVEQVGSPPQAAVLDDSVGEALVGHRLLHQAEQLNPHHDPRQVTQQELGLRMSAAERFSMSDLYLGNRVSEALGPIEAYAQAAPPSAAALAWSRLLNQSAAILVRTRTRESAQAENQASGSHPVSGNGQHANRILDLIPPLQARAEAEHCLSANDARELRQISEIVPAMKAWNRRDLAEAERLFAACSSGNSMAAEALRTVHSERCEQRSHPLSNVIRALLRNAYQNRIQNAHAYNGNYSEEGEAQIEAFLSQIEQLFSSGHCATYEEALNLARHQPPFAGDAVIQDFFNSSAEVSTRVRTYLHNASNMDLSEATVRQMSLNLAHDLGEISAGFMMDVGVLLGEGLLCVVSGLGGGSGDTQEVARRWNRLGERWEGTKEFWDRGWNDWCTVNEAMFDTDRSEGLGVFWDWFSEQGRFEHAGPGAREAAERYMSAAREIAQGYQDDAQFRAQARQLLNDDFNNDEGIYQFGEVVRQCTLVGARNRQDVCYSLISIGAVFSGSLAVGLAGRAFTVTALRGALISGAVNGMFQTCAQSLQQMDTWGRDENLTYRLYGFGAQMLQSGATGALSAVCSMGIERLGFLARGTRWFGAAGKNGAREWAHPLWRWIQGQVCALRRFAAAL